MECIYREEWDASLGYWGVYTVRRGKFWRRGDVITGVYLYGREGSPSEGQGYFVVIYCRDERRGKLQRRDAPVVVV